MKAVALVLPLVAVLTLGACGDRSPEGDPVAGGPVANDPVDAGEPSGAAGLGSVDGADTGADPTGDAASTDEPDGSAGLGAPDTGAGAAGDSATDDPDGAVDPGGTDTGTDAAGDPASTDDPDGAVDPGGTDTDTDAAGDSATDAADDPDGVTDPDPADGSGSGSTPEPGALDGSDPGGGTDGASGSGTDPVDEEDLLIPAVPGNSDTGRLLSGLRRVVGAALLDLNERLRSGVELSAQQERCLGAFDPAFGEPLLAIDCERALASGGVPIYVARGAFYATETCTTSVAAGTVDGCVLASAAMSVPTIFEQAPGTRRPSPLSGSGVDIAYAIDGPTLRVASDEDALTGYYDCAVDLPSGTSLPGTGGDCAVRIRELADRIDALQPVL